MACDRHLSGRTNETFRKYMPIEVMISCEFDLSSVAFTCWFDDHKVVIPPKRSKVRIKFELPSTIPSTCPTFP